MRPVTRFIIPIRPKDGSEWITLQTDLGALVFPSSGDDVDIGGVRKAPLRRATVGCVIYSPTDDPVITVWCRPLAIKTRELALEWVRIAEANGWRVVQND